MLTVLLAHAGYKRPKKKKRTPGKLKRKREEEKEEEEDMCGEGGGQATRTQDKRCDERRCRGGRQARVTAEQGRGHEACPG